MGTLKNLFSLCFRIAVRVVFYALIFIVLSWALLGLTPTQTVTTAKKNIIHWLSFTHSITETANNMRDVARRHFSESSERVDGKDPYENFNATLEENAQSGQGL